MNHHIAKIAQIMGIKINADIELIKEKSRPLVPVIEEALRSGQSPISLLESLLGSGGAYASAYEVQSESDDWQVKQREINHEANQKTLGFMLKFALAVTLREVAIEVGGGVLAVVLAAVVTGSLLSDALDV